MHPSILQLYITWYIYVPFAFNYSTYLCSFYTQLVSYILTGEDGTTSLGTIAYGFKYTSYMVNGRIKHSGTVEVLDNVMQPVASCSARLSSCTASIRKLGRAWE